MSKQAQPVIGAVESLYGDGNCQNAVPMCEWRRRYGISVPIEIGIGFENPIDVEAGYHYPIPITFPAPDMSRSGFPDYGILFM
ncbi:hypothetical protein D3OALGA1CA_4982 [Olavius algarvensis associated proteobacterium Delta 3]|nr:hypothetical protein D3OALGA1CA_4982 [Olavius algarvensis associated proteobacterium Delta 3]